MSLTLDRAPLGYLPSGLPVFPIGGAEPRGINAHGDILTALADRTPLTTLWGEFMALQDAANAERTALDRVLSHPVTTAAEQVIQQVGGADFERASEYGIPVGMRLAPSADQYGATFDWYDLGSTFTWRFLAEAPAEQVRAVANGAVEADSRLTHGHIMAAIFDPTERVNENGTPVYGLWNADGSVPPPFNGRTFDGAHSHYLTTGSAALDGADLSAAINHVTHHGYGRPPASRVIVFCNTEEADVIRGFRVASGDPFDFIASAGAPSYLTDQTIIGDVAPADYLGLPLIGSFGSAWICDDALIPSGYVLVAATGGASSALNVCSLREHVRPELRGFRIVKGRVPDYPLIESFFSRGFGTGVRHRGAAVALQITASATYTAPSLAVVR